MPDCKAGNETKDNSQQKLRENEDYGLRNSISRVDERLQNEPDALSEPMQCPILSPLLHSPRRWDNKLFLYSYVLPYAINRRKLILYLLLAIFFISICYLNTNNQASIPLLPLQE